MQILAAWNGQEHENWQRNRQTIMDLSLSLYRGRKETCCNISSREACFHRLLFAGALPITRETKSRKSLPNWQTSPDNTAFECAAFSTALVFVPMKVLLA